MAATEVKQIPKSVWNIKKTLKDLQSNPIRLTDFDNDFILDETKHIDIIEYYRDVIVENE